MKFFETAKNSRQANWAFSIYVAMDDESLCAVLSGDVNKARELLLNRNDLGRGKTQALLNYACEGGHLDMVRMLVSEFKADVSWEALNRALNRSRDEVAEALISEFDCDTRDGTEAMTEACRHDCVGTVRALVRKHGGVHLKAGFFQYSILHQNRVTSDPLVVAVLCDAEKVVSCLFDEFGRQVTKYPPLLCVACGKGHTHLVKTLVVKYKANVNAQDHKNNTPLILAAGEGREEVVSLLLNNDFGCDVNVKGDLGQSFLHIACKKGYVDFLKTAIVKYKADINAQDHKNNTPLIMAALEGREEVVSLLLNNDFGCDVNVKGVSGQSFLHIACQKGYVDFIKTAIVKCKADVNAQDLNKNTPLMVAALMGRKEVVSLLLNNDFGCDVNVKNYLGQSFLHIACQKGFVDFLKTAVVKYKADINAQDHKNNTPLMVAALMGREEVVSLLLNNDFGCDVNVKVVSGQSFLHIACQKGYVDFLKTAVVKYKADINAQDHKNSTPLMVAALMGREEVVSLLLNNDFGCDVNVKVVSGQSFLHIACQKGYVDFLKTAIVKYKADINARDLNKNTPLMVAALEGREEVVSLLLNNDFGCDVNVKGGLGQSFLHIACQKGYVDFLNNCYR